MKKVSALSLAAAVMMFGAMVTSQAALAAGQEFDTPPPATGPVVYVTSQNLSYDSIVVATLPMKGPFQQLVPTDSGLETEFGPGDVGYLGGRWWIDANGNEEMDGEDLYFSCPLLGEGYAE